MKLAARWSCLFLCKFWFFDAKITLNSAQQIGRLSQILYPCFFSWRRSLSFSTFSLSHNSSRASMKSCLNTVLRPTDIHLLTGLLTFDCRCCWSWFVITFSINFLGATQRLIAAEVRYLVVLALGLVCLPWHVLSTFYNTAKDVDVFRDP